MFASGVAGDSWWTYDLLKDIYHSAKSMKEAKTNQIFSKLDLDTTLIGINMKKFMK